MALEITPEHLPVVSSQLDAIADSAIASLVQTASTCVVFPPGWDYLSLMVLPQVTAAYGQSFYGCTGDGFVHREPASASLPSMAVAYSGADIIDATGVASTGATLGEMPR
ncbi:hypothetical protein [Nocardia sp. NPDC005998]|uniref:hypothetical protein n=1 Tax=Nocardia sp. NPDC005998 TaxID=3156894 RepID=UPI0033B47BF1